MVEPPFAQLIGIAIMQKIEFLIILLLPRIRCDVFSWVVSCDVHLGNLMTFWHYRYCLCLSHCTWKPLLLREILLDR